MGFSYSFIKDLIRSAKGANLSRHIFNDEMIEKLKVEGYSVDKVNADYLSVRKVSDAF